MAAGCRGVVGGGIARLGIALGVMLALGLGGGGIAQASSWSVVKLPDGGVAAGFYGVSCPGLDFCVAVGGNNTIASSRNPTGGAADWRIVRPDGKWVAPFAQAAGAGATASNVIYPGAQIRGVSCPSAGLCVAVSFDGQVYTSTDPGGPASAWQVFDLTAPDEPNVHMGGVSCPGPSLCVAVGLGGKLVTSTNPTGGPAAWAVTALAAPYDLRGVSCASPALCVAVGNEGSIVTSTNPTGGAAAWQSVGVPGGAGSLNGISCPSTGLCVTANAGKIILSTNPSSSASWTAIAAGTGLPVKGVACPSTAACAALDNNADVIVSTNPTAGPGAWSFENVIPFASEQARREGISESNGTYGIACAGTTLCVGVGMEFKIISSTDPFSRDAAVKNPIRAVKSKRPRVVITRHPAKRLDHRRGGNRVAFRFRAIGKAVRFTCRLHGKRYRPCKSPARYRVGGGKHAFRVRAIGPGGRKGPPTVFHFRVGALTERAPVGSCPPGSNGSIARPCVRA